MAQITAQKNEVTGTNRSRVPEGGNALVIALFAVVLIVGGVMYFLLLQPVAPPTTPGGNPDQTIETGDTNGLSPDSGAPESAAETFQDTPPENSETATSHDHPEQTFYGRVVNPAGVGVSGAEIRVLPLTAVGQVSMVIDGAVANVPANSDLERVTQIFEETAPVLADNNGEFQIAARLGHSISIVADGYAPRLARLSTHDAPARRGFDQNNDIPGEIRAFLPGDQPIPSWAIPELSERKTIHLDPVLLLTGTVTSSTDGAPATGAEVAVRPGGDDSSPFMAMTRGGLTDGPRGWVNADGQYAILLDEAIPLQVGARSGSSTFAPTPLDQYVNVTIEPGDVEVVLDFTLDPGGVVQGRVVDGNGAPRQETVVMIPQFELTELTSGAMLGEMIPRTAQSGKDGTFRIAGVSFGSAYNVSVNPDEFAPTTVLTQKLTDADPVAEVELVVLRGSTISGTVFSPDGEPLPEYWITLSPDFEELINGNVLLSGQLDNSTKMTSEDGSFVFQNIAAGKYQLNAGMQTQTFGPWGGPTDGLVIEVDGESDIAELEVIADDYVPNIRADLSGRVTNPEGVGIAGVTVTITEEDEQAVPMVNEAGEITSASEPVETVVITDRDGRFFAADAAIAGATVRAELDTFSSEVEYLEAGETEVTLVIEPIGTLRGIVRLSDGTPPFDEFRVSVRSLSEEISNSLQEQIETMMSGELGQRGEEDGTFELEGVSAGRLEVVVTAPGFAKSRSEPIDLSPGETVEGIQITLTRGARVFGTVIDPDGEALAGAKVLCTRASEMDSMTDLMAQSMPGLFSGNPIVTHEDGSYEIPNLEAGDYVIRALHDNFARSNPVTITVQSDGDLAAPEIAMLLGGSITGQVMREGTPVQGMMVQTFSTGAMKQAMTDSAGRFSFENLPDGTFMVMCMDLANSLRPGSGAGMRTREVEVMAGETANLNISFGTGFTIRGTVDNAPKVNMPMLVLRRPGGPAPEEVSPLDMEANLNSARYQVAMAMLDGEGAFEIQDIEPGEYILEMLRMPEDPSNFEAYEKMDRTPYVREKVVIRSGDVTVRARAKE